MCNFFFSSRRRHTRFKCDWSSDVCSSDLARHLGHTLSQVDRAHHSNLQFAGIFLSGHKHCSPPFNVIGPLISCLTFGVHSITSQANPSCISSPLPLHPIPRPQISTDWSSNTAVEINFLK